jgi:hypothetical protein
LLGGSANSHLQRVGHKPLSESIEQAAHVVDTEKSITPTVETSSAPLPDQSSPTEVPSTNSSNTQVTLPPQAPPTKSKFSTVLAILTPKLTNQKFISIAYGSITGSWKIDTSLVLPRLLRGSEAWGEIPETRPNIRFGTIYGAIKINLTILGEYDLDQRERVSIVLATEFGPIKCVIVKFKSLPLRVFVLSNVPC